MVKSRSLFILPLQPNFPRDLEDSLEASHLLALSSVAEVVTESSLVESWVSPIRQDPLLLVCTGATRRHGFDESAWMHSNATAGSSVSVAESRNGLTIGSEHVMIVDGRCIYMPESVLLKCNNGESWNSFGVVC